jgi:hypothetical protein
VADQEPEAPIRASLIDSTTLPERSRHDVPARPVRRRRSAGHVPLVVAPVDIPEDAEGRVEFFVVRAPADPVEAPAPAAEPPAAAPTGPGGSVPAPGLLALRSGWVAVGIMAAVLALVFVVVDLLLR